VNKLSLIYEMLYYAGKECLNVLMNLLLLVVWL